MVHIGRVDLMVGVGWSGKRRVGGEVERKYWGVGVSGDEWDMGLLGEDYGEKMRE